jgi:hypothetical protein
MEERLTERFSIMALHQAAHHRFVHLGSIPVDFDLFVHGRSK